MGHPWPIVPRLASMPNAPLHSTYARPPDGIQGPRCLHDLWAAKTKKQKHRGHGPPLGFIACRAGETRHVFCFSIRDHADDANAPSGGRVESLRKGLSGMDAARVAMGQGWPFAAGPWSNDGAREPDEVGPDARGKTSWLLLGRLPEVTRRKGGTVRPDNI